MQNHVGKLDKSSRENPKENVIQLKCEQKSTFICRFMLGSNRLGRNSAKRKGIQGLWQIRNEMKVTCDMVSRKRPAQAGGELGTESYHSSVLCWQGLSWIDTLSMGHNKMQKKKS